MTTQPITEASVEGFLREALSALSAQHGIQFNAASLNIHVDTSLYACVHAHGQCEFGATLVDAANAVAKKIGTPESLAAQKREEARRLLAEAEAISPETQNETAPVR